MVLAADRKLYRDPYAPCTQDWKLIQAQRKRRPPGWDGETRHGWRPRQGKKKRRTEVEPQGEQEERRELGDKQRSWSSGSETVPWWGQALTAVSGVRLCGASAAAAPSPVPSVCSQGQVCALSPRASTLAGWQALQLLFALGLSGTPGTHRSLKLLRGPAPLTSSTSVRPHLRYSQSWVGDSRLHPPRDGRGAKGTSCCFTAPHSDKQQPPREPNSTLDKERRHPWPSRPACTSTDKPHPVHQPGAGQAVASRQPGP